MITSPEQACNLALKEIGYPQRIGDIYEGSEASIVALEIYSQTRDEVIRSESWPWARRVLSLTLLKGPPPPGGYNSVQTWNPTYPPPGWAYEYAYPSDMIELGSIMRSPGLWPQRDPRPALWRVDNDPLPLAPTGSDWSSDFSSDFGPFTMFGPPQKVILANVAGAIAVYRARITDLTTWEPGAIATLVATLAKKFAVELAQSPDLLKEKQAESAGIATMADRHRG